jgi:YbbR domain-containing protein
MSMGFWNKNSVVRFRRRARQFGRSLWRALRRNWGLKIASFVFAIIIWAYVLPSTDPLREKTVAAVPVSITGEDTLRANGLALSERPNPESMVIKATVRANFSFISNITKNNLTATIDLSQITEPGTHRVRVDCTSNSGTVQRVAPQTVEVHVEERTFKNVSVRAELPEPTDDLWQSEISLSPRILTVNGPASQMERLSHVRVRLPSMAQETGVDGNVSFVPVDTDGNDMERALFAYSSDTVYAMMQVYPKKQVPVQVNWTQEPSAAWGYEIGTITPEPDMVTIAAPAEVLDDIEMVETEPLSAEMLDADAALTAELIRPSGIVYMERSLLQVHVQVKDIEQQRTFEGVSVRAVNGSGTATFTGAAAEEMVTVSVRGPMAVIETLSREMLDVYFDASGITPGQEAEVSLQWRWTPGNAPERAGELTVSLPETVRASRQAENS